MARFLRRQVTYKLRPPVAVSAAPQVFVAPPLRTRLAPPVRTRTRSRLNAPSVVGPAYTPFGPQVTRAVQPRQGRQAHYLLRPPATLQAAAAPFVAGRVRVQTAPALARSRTSYGLRAPATLAQPFIARRVRAHIAPQPVRAQAHYALRPPTTLAFSATPERLSFQVAVRRATEQHSTVSTLPPAAIPPIAAAQQPVSAKLARSPRQGRTVRFRLAPPATLATPVAPFRPLQSVYATATKRMSQRRSYSSKLQPPAVVAVASGDNPVGSVFDPNYFLLIHP